MALFRLRVHVGSIVEVVELRGKDAEFFFCDVLSYCVGFGKDCSWYNTDWEDFGSAFRSRIERCGLDAAVRKVPLWFGQLMQCY